MFKNTKRMQYQKVSHVIKIFLFMPGKQFEIIVVQEVLFFGNPIIFVIFLITLVLVINLSSVVVVVVAVFLSTITKLYLPEPTKKIRRLLN